MTNLTIKHLIGNTPFETSVLLVFYKVYPAFYIYSKDEIILTKKMFEEEYKNHICDIIDHEYLHAIVAKLEGKEVSKKLDNLLYEMLEWM